MVDAQGTHLDDEDLYLDGACFDHVCHPKFMAQHPIIENDKEFAGMIRTADGTSMTYIGDRAVPFAVEDQNGNTMEILVKFKFLDKVQRSLLSVSKLTQSGYKLDGGHIIRGPRKIWFDRVGGMFRLRATPTHKILHQLRQRKWSPTDSRASELS